MNKYVLSLAGGALLAVTALTVMTIAPAETAALILQHLKHEQVSAHFGWLPVLSAAGLSSRSIIGEYYARLEQHVGSMWTDRISNRFESNMPIETYKWLGQAPQLRQWIGGRNPKGLRENGISIENLTFESTLEISTDDLRRDKTGQVMARVRELADRTNGHDAKLLTTLLVNGESTACYDSQYFFDTDHSEGDSGTQDNDLTGAAATNTQPTAAEAEAAVLASVQAILGFKDDQGEPMNTEAREFMVMVPTVYWTPFSQALNNPVIVDGSTSRTNTIVNLGGFKIDLVVNPLLTSGAKFYTFRTDAEIKPLIRQVEVDPTIDAIAEGSEEEFKNRRHLYGVTKIGNVGYGYWQRACLYTFT